jgi:dipeptidase
MTTHTNDCAECDIRVTYVKARDWPAGSKRPLFAERNAYPKYAELPEYNVHGPEYLHSNVDSSIYDWPPSTPIEYIDQVPHTYGYILGSYAIQNEKQVSMGESTCRAIFWSMPVYGGGKSRINVRGMMEIAMERCDNARCAIQTMGDLATTYGYFGAAGADDNVENQQNEAGEALTVTDKEEAWMFHVMPDDTGASAIWVAQRVPDDHIAVVANQFVITSVDLNDKENFMGSDNIFDVAIRNNLWDPKSGTPFNFAKVFVIINPCPCY